MYGDGKATWRLKERECSAIIQGSEEKEFMFKLYGKKAKLSVPGKMYDMGSI